MPRMSQGRAVMKTCIYCGCSEAEACEGGCAWADETQTVCSICASAAQTAAELVKILGVVLTKHVGATVAFAEWDQFATEQQRLLVMTCRATVDAIRDGLLQALGEDAVEAQMEVAVLARFLLARCPEELQEENEGLSDVVIRLLEPHIGSRIVLPGAGR
jgi:hypothetical protein